MEQLLARRPDLDAVFCASDLMAAGALGVLQASGRHVPDDVAIVGYDDSPVATTTRPPSPASGSRSRRWAARWSICSARAWTVATGSPAR